MSIDDDITFMERIPLLGLLGRAALRVLAIGSETRQISAGDVLFVAGEPADAGYVVQEGSFSLLPDSATGAAQEITVGRGMLLGELALMTETIRPATATALEAAIVIRISRTLFLKMLDGYPDAARRLRDGLMVRSEQSARDIQGVRAALAKADGKS
ncbi:MAG: cyclic nucleotide-binding domain-containing protein [Rhizobiales bacterium]|nr:cyclic nucleotide-binding domain-containing protein [Hyphomicrobiales bacterium]